MCFKTILAGLTGGAPAILTSIGEGQARHATTRAYQRERDRQHALEAEQQGYFADSLARAGAVPDPANMAAAVEHRRSSLADAILPAGAYLPGSDSASPVVRTSADRMGAEGHADASRLAAALAGLAGPGDQLLDLNIASGRNAQRIGMDAGFMRGSFNALDAEMEAASHRGETLRGLGALAHQLAMAAVSGGTGAAGGLG